MKSEDQLLLICLTQDFTAEHVQAVKELSLNSRLDWEKIERTADQHGISGLIYHNLQICQLGCLEIPESAFTRLKLSAYRNIIAKHRQRERLIRALTFFREHNLDVMLLKGAALDLCVYQDPTYVLSDDIDIMIHTKQENLLQDELTEINHFFHKQSIEYDFFSHHDLDINGLLPLSYERIWDQAIRSEYCGYPVFLMTLTDLLISLCINSNRHRYFRLKSIFDINATIQTNPDISWELVAERACDSHCENIVYTALLVTSVLTKCNMPAGWENYFKINYYKKHLINITVNSLINYISFYPFPYSGISITGRPLHLSIFLPYIAYSRTHVIKKIAFAIRVHGN